VTIARVVAWGLVALQFGLAPVAVAAAPTIVVAAEQISYTGDTPVTITGSMSPPPSTTTFATVVMKNPLGGTLENTLVPMNGFGIFQLTILAGCTPDWTPGTYTVTASASSLGEAASASTTFEYYLGLVALDRVSATVAPQIVLGGVMVTITGTVAACSGSVAPTNVLISVKNPSGATVFQDQVTPTGPAAYGNYTDSFVAGGTPDWTPGVYTVTSQYRSSSNPPSPAFAASAFSYSQAGGIGASITQQTGRGTTSNGSQSISPAGLANQGGAASLVLTAAIATAAGIGVAFLVLRARRKPQRS
jgi:hypothetical protein